MVIDWVFLDDMEGMSVLKGYVPKNKKGEVIGKSGTTVATGIDIGQMGYLDLMNLFTNVPREKCADLIEKLTPYLLLKGSYAVAQLKKYPLELTYEEAELLDELVKRQHRYKLVSDWESKSFVKFDDLPDEMQTVMMSLAYNFGPKLSKALPQTFKILKQSAESKDYRSIYHWLKTFPSKNPELKLRRDREASYIAALIPVERIG